jgi:capsular polysaccharide biosynthesis protein
MRWQSLRRNWLVAILGLLATVSLAVMTTKLVPAKYVATSQMVLLPPLSQPNASYNGVVNPYMGLAGLQSMADVVSSAMMDDDTAKVLVAGGVTQYSVQYDSLSAGPILIVQATASSPAKAGAALAALDHQVPLTVARLQDEASISPKAFITAQVIARPGTPVKSDKTQLRAAGLAFIVGLVLTLLAVSTIDAWRIRRRRRGAPAGDVYDDVETAAASAGHSSMSQRDGPSEQTLAGREPEESGGVIAKPLIAPAAVPSGDSGDGVPWNDELTMIYGRDGTHPPSQ